jgi:hypothetical protein
MVTFTKTATIKTFFGANFKCAEVSWRICHFHPSPISAQSGAPIAAPCRTPANPCNKFNLSLLQKPTEVQHNTTTGAPP